MSEPCGQLCGSRGPQKPLGLYCSLDAGHGGVHVAKSGGVHLANWPDPDTVLLPGERTVCLLEACDGHCGLPPHDDPVEAEKPRISTRDLFIGGLGLGWAVGTLLAAVL